MTKHDAAEAIKPASKTRAKKVAQPLEALYVPDALLEPITVTAVTGKRAEALRVGAKDGSFPAPIRLSPTCIRYRASDILAWLRAQKPEQFFQQQ